MADSKCRLQPVNEGLKAKQNKRNVSLVLDLKIRRVIGTTL